MSKSIEEMEAAFEVVLAEFKASMKKGQRSMKAAIAHADLSERFDAIVEELREAREDAAKAARRAEREARVAGRQEPAQPSLF